MLMIWDIQPEKNDFNLVVVIQKYFLWDSIP